MAKWEYKSVTSSEAAVAQQLSDLGAEEWEVIAAEVIREAGGGWHWAVLLKREIPGALSGVRAHHADQRQVKREEEQAAAAKEFTAAGYDLPREQS